MYDPNLYGKHCYTAAFHNNDIIIFNNVPKDLSNDFKEETIFHSPNETCLLLCETLIQRQKQQQYLFHK